MTTSHNPKIAFFLDNSKIPDVDFSDYKSGNPGCGASEFVVIQVASGLSQRGHKVTLYVTEKGRFPTCLNSRIVSNIEEAFRRSIVANEFLVHRLEISSNSFVYDKIPNRDGLRAIPWLQLTPPQTLARRLATEPSVTSVIAVGANQVTRLRDNPIFKKINLISNPIAKPNRIQDWVLEPTNQIVYVGALTPAKGFHILADQWAKVKREVPDAKLKVIGSGLLYDKHKTLGSRKLAESSYERRIFQKLDFLDESVEFLGTLADTQRKNDLIAESKIGIVNPSGQTETFCVAAAEIQSMGVPVVSIRRFGLRDTIKNRKTGLQYRSQKRLHRHIVKLIRNEELRRHLGQNGPKWTEKYELENVLNEWENFLSVLENKEGNSLNFNCAANPKFQYLLASVNGSVLNFLNGKWPTLVEISDFLRRVARKLLRRRF